MKREKDLKNENIKTPEDLSFYSEQNDFLQTLRSRLYSKSFNVNHSLFEEKNSIPSHLVTFRKATKKRPSIQPLSSQSKRKRGDEFENSIQESFDEQDMEMEEGLVNLRTPTNVQETPFQLKRESFKRGRQLSRKLEPVNTFVDSKKKISSTRKDPFWFIQRIKNHPTLEFVYLNRVERSKTAPYNPYDLEIVPHHLANKDDYYTLSAQGVTHFKNGADADFTSLDQWLKEYEIFHKILQIPFFKKYRVWKAFTAIRKRVITKKIERASKVLTKRLFIINPNLQDPISRIRKICLEIKNLELFKDNKGRILNLNEFVRIQRLQKLEVKRDLKRKVDEIVQIAEHACRDYMTAAGFGDQFKSIEEMERTTAPQISVDETPRPSSRQTVQTTRSMTSFKSIAFQTHQTQINDESYQMSYTQLSQKKAECKRLMSFIRYVEYLIFEALLELHYTSMESILAKVVKLSNLKDQAVPVVQKQDLGIHTEEDENCPLFRTEVLLEHGELAVSPSKENFDEEIEQVIQGFFEATKLERLMKKKVFNEYLESILNDRGEEITIGDGQDIKEVISKEEPYLDLLANIRETLFNAYNQVVDYANKFDTILKIYKENKNMDINAIREANHDLAWFRKEMTKYKEQDALITKMETEKNMGIFYVDTKQLKEIFSPSAKDCLKAIHDLLPILAKEKNDILYKEIKEAVRVLQQPPSTVEQFVDYLQYTQKVSENMDNLERQFKTVSNIYKLLEEEQVEVPPDDRDRFTVGTVSTISTLRAAIALAEDSKEDRISKFTIDLERRLEDLRSEVKSIMEKSQDDIISNVESDIDEVIEYLENLKSNVEHCKKTAIRYAEYQELFKVSPEEMEEIDPVTESVNIKLLLWKSLKEWNKLVDEWNNLTFKAANANKIKEEIEKYAYVVSKVQQSLPENPVVPLLTEKVEKWQIMLPILTDLKNPSLKTRHWRVLDNIIGKPVSTTDFKLEEILDDQIVKKRKNIEEVSQQASNEQALEELLKTVNDHWTKTEFEIKTYKEWNIIGDVEDITTLLEDDQITVSTILSSGYVAAIKSRVEEWEKNLRTMMKTVHEWVQCQRKWLYLESVFSASADIQKELKEDAQLFFQVDRFFKETMKKTKEHPNVFRSTTVPGLYDKFVLNNSHLEKVEKALQKYLGEKRDAFPRFYFLSDADLLDILAQTRNPQAVQPHLIKCFDNIKSLEFEDVKVTKMISSEGEEVPIKGLVRARGNVEEWLYDLERAMVETLRDLMRKAVKEYPTQKREEWILNQKAQIALTVTQIYWARDITKCLLSENPLEELKKYYETTTKQLTQLAALARTNLNKLQRKIVGTLIILDVHAVSVVKSMIEEKVSSVTDFGWLKQLKYYWDEERKDCFIRQSNSEFRYGYEYLGCFSRLVITPLTDRVYMTMTGALHLRLGGAPAGPAGTGKTETVKDLAKALALQCVVFNCSEGITYEMMSKFFSGIVQTGSWCCFDEFNRINIEVLSVIASQLQTIQDALRANLETFIFDDRELKLRSTCGVFITMNPGYAGRTELPDNLKALFRPVAVMIPDYGLIAEVILFSEGFENATVLSKKMVQLYKLSNEQLSSQDHYDFGMRAVKSVLVMAGELKRANRDVPEEVVLIRAMIDSNVPKFVGEDIELFYGIVSDLFPTIKHEEAQYGVMAEALEKMLEEEGLQKVPEFMKKVYQLYETMNVRHGVMLVGPSGGGKTICRDILAKTLTHLSQTGHEDKYHRVVQYTLNPKSVKYGELYGVFNRDTNEWFNGLIPHFAILAVKDRSLSEKWLIFDGPVDTLWIESMNSVLDDSKLLCLDNTDRIKLYDDIHLLFEVQDLSVASPATVSRCGMVYIDPVGLGWLPVVKSWIQKSINLKDEIKDYLYNLFEEYVTKGLQFIKEHCKQDIETIDINLVTSLCDLFVAILNFEKVELHNDMDDNALKTTINNLFVFCFVWSIGGNIITQSRPMFDKFVRDELEDICGNIPRHDTVYDYYIDFNTNTFKPWSDRVTQEFVYDKNMPYFEIMIPTADTETYTYFLNTLIHANKPVLLNGKTGVGKTVIVNSTLRAGKDKYSLDQVTIQFSAQTTSKRTQEMIESKLILRKSVLRAPPGRKVVLFIDDLNMPVREQFGAQPPIELLRQLLGYGGFYDLEDKENFPFRKVKSVTTVAACGPPGGGRNPITQRLVRLFHCFHIPDLSNASMEKIFSTILAGFLQDFTEEVRQLKIPITRASIELYNKTCETFRPTPTCVHYTFNLRDLSKVFQGILQVTSQNVRTAALMTRLWVHESMRCFYDRLVNQQDRRKFEDLIIQLLSTHFRGQTYDHEELFVKNPIIFGDFGGTPEINYVEIKSYQRLATILDGCLGVYNMKNPNKMDLVFFQDAAKHAARIVRILKQERGNALLVGVGGSGKQSLTRLAASIVNYELFEIKLKRGYNLESFREDLQSLYKMAGVDGKPVVFLLSDSQIISESFLEDINNILNSGEVPNLFPPEEREKIINQLRPEAEQAGVHDTRENIYNFFITRVRNNLHIVLCMSPVGEKFRTRTRMLPSLVNCCTIDWFDEWPKEALHAVAERKLFKVNFGSPEIKKAITEMCVLVHSSVVEAAKTYYEELRRHYYLTPSSYLSFIEFYLDLLEKKKVELTAQKARLTTGLSILKETNEKVEQMQKELEALQPVLKQKTEEVNKMLVEITEGTQRVNEQRKIIGEEEKIVREKAEKAEAIEKEASDRLSEALPALEKAQKAVEVINKGDIAEIKKYTKPAEEVVMVARAVEVLLGHKDKDISWDSSVRTMSDPNFVSKLLNYDKDNIPEDYIPRVKKIAKHPNFNEEIVGRKSKAAQSLCMWVLAMIKYSEVAKEVGPLRESLKKAKAEAEDLKSKLEKKQAELQSVEQHLAELNKKMEQTTAEKEDLEERTQISARRLKSAKKLTTSLSDEYERWQVAVEELNTHINDIPGNVFLGAAAISYYGAFTSDYRRRLIELWENECRARNIPISADCSIQKVLSSPVEIRDWTIAGLPTDLHSIQNAILVSLSNRWPLIIDPQGQANNWIKTKEKMNGLKVIKLTDSNYLRVLDSAIRIGTPVLIEDLGETIDPALDPLLQKQVINKQGRLIIKLGDSSVDYNPKFRLYLTTKLSNPHYLPEVCIKVTLINFTVTERGLEDQLLGDVVRKLLKEIEEKKDSLVVSVAEDKKMLNDLEEQILDNLQQSKGGNILDDEKLIKTLDDSKYMANMIVKRVKESEDTERELDKTRELYRPIAKRGSLLFFVMASLSHIDSMYQYSLEYFKQLFNLAIDQVPNKEQLALEQLLPQLIESITETVYNNICRGLFEKDKMIFSFLICSQILKDEGEISPKAWNYLLRGAQVKKEGALPNPDSQFIKDTDWDLLCVLDADLPEFNGICEDITNNIEEYKEFARHPNPYHYPLKGHMEAKMNKFGKLLLIKCLCLEKLQNATIDFTADCLGKKYTEPPARDLNRVLADTTATTPIIFILSTGADPTDTLRRFASEKNYDNRLHIQSLGQGQEEKARRLIERGRKSGDWVLLQNCHLAISFLPELERIISEFHSQTSVLHPDFRLWLTSMPEKRFPIPILQNGIKVTNEPPKGIRANLMRSFADIREDYFETFKEEEFPNCKKRVAFKKLLFGLCMFHAVIQERKKFGPLGWNIIYEFNESDLHVAKLWLQMFIDEQPEIPYVSLNYVIGEIVYGGRVTDPWDRRCILSILKRYFSPEILKDDYKFASDSAYLVPSDGTLKEFREHVLNMPDRDDPEIFCMHENANIVHQLQETDRTLKTVLSIQPRTTTGSSGGGVSNEELARQIATKIINELPKDLDKSDAGKNTFIRTSKGIMDSLSTVLSHEMILFNKLLRVMRFTLNELLKAMDGLVVMSMELEGMFRDLLDNKVPELWSNEVYPSLKPLGTFIEDLHKRVQFMYNWLKEGRPKCFWISGFFFPQGFLTGVLQMHARKYEIAIDTLGFKFEVLPYETPEEVPEAPEDGVYVYGMYLDGAYWDREKQSIVESKKGEMTSPLPVIHFLPEVDHQVTDDVYECPLYKTSVRKGELSSLGQSTNFIVAIELPNKTDKTDEFWVLQGVAALCQPDR